MPDTGAASDIERPPERTPEQLQKDWLEELGLAEADNKDFIRDGKDVVDRYKSEKKSSTGRRVTSRRFNILYSNTEVLRSTLYGRAAKPDVRRRFADNDPAARTAAEVIERSLIYCAETYDVDRPVEQGILDYLLPGRGVMRVEYEPVIQQRPVMDPMTSQPVMGEDGQPQTEPFVAEQNLYERYVFWEDYRQSPARDWNGVWWVSYRHVMDRGELRDLLDETAIPQTSKAFAAATDVPLNWSPESDDRRPAPDSMHKAEVWEIWDKSQKQRIWVVPGYTKALRLDQDPYGLEDFFCQAPPLVGYSTNDTAIPEPEFHSYQDQADDLDEITARISILTKGLKRRGVRDQSIEELQRLARAADNDFIGVKDWSTLQAKGGLQAVFQTEDISIVSGVLVQLYQQRTMLVQEIFEITGIADIMRGNSDPNETLGAQQLKAQFGSTRIKRRQKSVQKWVRDTYKLKAEIIAEHFEPQVLSAMTGQQVTPDVINLLRSDKLRSYRIDIDTDSMTFEDSGIQQQQITQLIEAVTKFMQVWGPMVMQQPLLLPMAFEMLALAVRSFKAGRTLEDVIEQTKNQLTQMAQQAIQQPKPDPHAEKAKADIALKQADMQMRQQSHASDMQMQQQDHAADMQGRQMDLQGKVIDLQAKKIGAVAELQKAHMDAMQPHVSVV